MIKPWFIPLEDVISFPYTVYAHTRAGKDRETLQEHTKLCESYLTKILSERNIEQPFLKIARMFGLDSEEKSLELYFEMLFQVITFHDVGKINPCFQSDKMGNADPKEFAIQGLKGSAHSLLSAVIYLNHFMQKINSIEISKLQKRQLSIFCLINGFVISRHHSNLGSIKEFLVKFSDNGDVGTILQGMTLKHDFMKDPIYNMIGGLYLKKWKNFRENLNEEGSIAVYTYTRFLYSLLVSCDYYATSEYGNGVSVNAFGNDSEIYKFAESYEGTDLLKGIREYETGVSQPKGINKLRCDIFLEAEKSLRSNLDKNIYFLEAPTGSGKSNVSMNLSFQLLKAGLQKIYYVYPFNTLVDQNLETLKDIFGKDSAIFNKIAVLNSNTPIKQEIRHKDESEGEDEIYTQALLDRQFLNYPFVLTTHVSLFETMFGDERESAFGFSQLQDSIVVLDEIQSYKNKIWSEIITFLKIFASLLNMKIIIMSATLPDLSYLTSNSVGVAKLLQNRDRYFTNPQFKSRVNISYELLGQEINLEMLADYIAGQDIKKNKIAVEFIKKSRAYEFADMLAEDERITAPIYFISGDDNRVDRAERLKIIKENSEKGLILIATQVIEAGVDIDMDIGYKDISKLDSEEQFLGRINRSCKRSGKVYFFNLDDASRIYSDGDYRMNKELTLVNEDMQLILNNKDFSPYYNTVMEHLKESYNCSYNDDENLKKFFNALVGGLDFTSTAKRMKLIEDSDWDMPIYLARDLIVDGEKISGMEVWEEYKKLLKDQMMPYAKKQVCLSNVRSKLNYFIYQIKKTSTIEFNDMIGELHCISNGERYFKEGRLDKKSLEEGGSMFLDM
ncbi:MAG TPA: CRISPR-associated helicase/endonuclease Cas3 [Clostridium sp.]|jgi:CRISPR-associated endonuclease/helicase Cas3|uniref:CRISPR-associated endonuclease/helicase Cas3 n=1 Tax=Muricomes intestini TaxID=1796634 RepID=A0A4R3K120_9FIRM|nr:CRISPR-associated helicase Cas3' [Muricomes intestini]TCS75228.1 CRISPR-associated endonuclease/helicase Cas3 [Muricomes intestini]HBC95499.1 CRISPR-associated helicase/endonuclease Cas3 [Clostridium sp.]